MVLLPFYIIFLLQFITFLLPFLVRYFYTNKVITSMTDVFIFKYMYFNIYMFIIDFTLFL